MRAEARAQRFDSKRQEVLRGAGRVFARLGFHNASLNDIGAELGTTAAALYYYAKSKDELLNECRKVALEAIDAALNEAKTTSGNGFDSLRIFFLQYAEVVCSDFGRCLVGIQIGDLPPRLQKVPRTRQQTIRKEVQALIRAGVKDGSIRACDDLLVANMLFGSFNHLMRWWSPKGRMSLEAVASAYLDTVASGIRITASSRNKK
jgi:AcrR family transcriptional regulator